jgi:hypothetical protein
VAREEAALTDVRRKDRIYLYGVDYMSTHDCLAYFEDYGPSFIEWINDSACECGTQGGVLDMGTGHRPCRSECGHVCLVLCQVRVPIVIHCASNVGRT